jgi:hypothetical protein
MPAATSTSPARRAASAAGALQPHDLGRLEFAREEQVVGAARADRDAVALRIDLRVGRERRGLGHQVAALDQHIGRGEAQPFAARRVDGEEADVGLLVLHRVDRGGGLLEHHQFHGHAQAARELARQVDRHAQGLAGGGVLVGEDRVAQVDGSAQRAARCEGGDEGGRNRGCLRLCHGVGAEDWQG